MIINLAHKVKAPEPFQPNGKYGSYEETLEAFKTKRKARIKYVEENR